MTFAGDACHTAFTKRGWIWGDSWPDRQDYQHFEQLETPTGFAENKRRPSGELHSGLTVRRRPRGPKNPQIPEIQISRPQWSKGQVPSQNFRMAPRP
jgi:hypothetical protein